jgi:hypothetical protein
MQLYRPLSYGGLHRNFVRPIKEQAVGWRMLKVLVFLRETFESVGGR